MSTDLFLSRLERVRRTGKSTWSALCPAHNDNSPSLSVTDTGAKLLFHCHGGCHPDDVLAAVGLRWTDLDADRWRAAKHQAVQHTRWLANKDRRRRLQGDIDLDHERGIVRVCSADIRGGKPLSQEDRARLDVAMERLRAAEGAAG